MQKYCNLRIADIYIKYGQSRIHVRKGKCGKPRDAYIFDKLLADHLPYSPKPQSQRDSTILKYRASGNRKMILRSAASVESTAHIPAFLMTTAWTGNP